MENILSIAAGSIVVDRFEYEPSPGVELIEFSVAPLREGAESSIGLIVGEGEAQLSLGSLVTIDVPLNSNESVRRCLSIVRGVLAGGLVAYSLNSDPLVCVGSAGAAFHHNGAPEIVWTPWLEPEQVGWEDFETIKFPYQR